MKIKPAILCLYLGISFVFQPISAFAVPIATAQALLGFKVQNNTNDSADNFDIEIMSQQQFAVTSVESRPFLRQDPLINPAINTPTMTSFIRFQDDRMLFQVKRCGAVTDPRDCTNTFVIRTAPVQNEFRITRAMWTKGPINLGQAMLPGFRLQGDPIYTIFNDMTDAIGIQDLDFLINVSEISIDTLLSSISDTSRDFILSPGASMDFTILEDLNPGKFFFARGKLVDIGSGAEIGAFVHGVQAIPEPSTILLFAIGGFGLLGYGHRQRQHGRVMGKSKALSTATA